MIKVDVKFSDNTKEYENNFKKAMSQFKKKVSNSKILYELRDRQYYKKPSEKRREKQKRNKKGFQNEL